MAKVMLLSYPEKRWPILREDSWEPLARISGVSREALVQYMNLEDLDPLAISMVYFLISPKIFRREWPKMYGQLNDLLLIFD